jgi:hypothetical protein
MLLAIIARHYQLLRGIADDLAIVLLGRDLAIPIETFDTRGDVVVGIDCHGWRFAGLWEVHFRRTVSIGSVQIKNRRVRTP